MIKYLHKSQIITKPHISSGEYIAYRQSLGKQNKFGIVFLGGFMSDMNGTKANFLENYCKERNYNFIRFDYFGHGVSSGKFTDGTISIWLNNVLDIIDNLTNYPLILVGSSMGGWLMLLAALKRPLIVKGLVGISAAPDFTKNLIWNALSGQQRQELLSNKIIHIESEFSDTPYPISLNLILDGRKHLLLNKDINITCPIRLLHGALDKDVPAMFSKKLIEKLKSKDARLTISEISGHRFCDENELMLIKENLEEIILNFVTFC